VPTLTGRVVDRAGMMSPGARQSLEQSLARFEAETGHQIVVHTTPSLEGLAIEDYSLRVAEAWKIGQKGLDNGVILTIAPTERELRIEPGYGLEGVLPDAICRRIIDDVIVPRLRSGDADGAITAGVRAIQSFATGEKLPLPQHRGAPGGVNWLQLVWIVFILFVVLGRSPLLWWLFGARALGAGRRGWGGPSYGGSSWGGGGFGGGGFGGGGFSGGGGGFGGGGASGRW